MQRETRCLGSTARVVATAIALAAVGGPLMGSPTAGRRTRDVRAFVTQWNVHGIPYREARALGARAVPELVSMLGDPGLEAHWTKVVWVLGCIGDRSATGALIDFLGRQRGEISVDTFRATLAVLPALGHLARAGDAAAFEALTSFTRPEAGKAANLSFSYRRYTGEALREVLGRTAIQGLGIAGTPETLAVLESMNSKDLRTDWRDNVEEAIALNTRVARLGPARAFAEEGKR